MASELAAHWSRPIAADHILIDAPPPQREVQFKVDIFQSKVERYRPLVDVSPVVRTLAETQFDDYVKRVRIFLHPDLVRETDRSERHSQSLERLLAACCQDD
jgi:hypothetical protein